jgi:hypothetical protein
MATTKNTVKKSVKPATPGNLVLQWLTYAFWGWTILALAWLTALGIGHYLHPETTSYDAPTTVAYALAAVVVLFVISLVSDIFYSRQEPAVKTGASSLIMIIHAVLFALFGIGALIFAVFALVRIFVGEAAASYGDSGAKTMLYTGLLIAAVYALTLLRTVRTFKPFGSTRFYWLVMAAVTVGVVWLGVTGPVWQARETRDDRLIERGLPVLSEAIRAHSAKADTLPASLSAVKDEVKGDARTLIDRNLVEYKPGGEISDGAEGSTPELFDSISRGYEYQLCVTYKAKKGDGTYYAKPAYDMDRQISPDTWTHDAGRVCYDLVTNTAYERY